MAHRSSNETVYTTSSFGSSLSTPPPSPTKVRRRPEPAVGVDPRDLVGKTLTRVQRSPNHPALTLDFSDNTAYRLLVDGYNPGHGVPKELEMDDTLDNIFNPPNGQLSVALPIIGCTSITLSDKAFQKESRWDQNHLGIAFKFGGGASARWHCVWATLQERDEKDRCIFRSYNDVYLACLQRASPRKIFHRKQNSSGGKSMWK